MATIPKLTEQTALINAIKGNSVMALEDNFKGNPAVLKQKFVDMSVAQTNSVMKAIDDTIVANVNTELSTLATADTTLQTNITNEANTRASADTANTNAITTEASTRQTNDETLQTNIDTLTTNLASETSNRTSADNTLQTNIDNEEQARKDADALLVAKEAGKSLISDTEIARLALVDNYDDTPIQNWLISLSNDVTNLSSPIDYLGSMTVNWSEPITTDETVQSAINTYATSISPTLHAGHALLINNTGNYIFPLNGNEVTPQGYWLWIYNEVQWQPSIKMPNTFTNDLTNELKANYDSAYTHSQSTHLSIGTLATQAGRGDLTQTAYDHSQSAHAPSNAQKNSDITKAEIEAKLTGELTSHSHALPAHNHTVSNITDFPTIPTQTSQLTNNSGYQTASDVNTTVNGKFSFDAGTSTLTITTT